MTLIYSAEDVAILDRLMPRLMRDFGINFPCSAVSHSSQTPAGKLPAPSQEGAGLSLQTTVVS